jgi:hypothetical protein
MLHKVTHFFSSALYICAHMIMGTGKMPPLSFCISNFTLFYFYISVFGLLPFKGKGRVYDGFIEKHINFNKSFLLSRY